MRAPSSLSRRRHEARAAHRRQVVRDSLERLAHERREEWCIAGEVAQKLTECIQEDGLAVGAAAPGDEQALRALTSPVRE